MCERVLAEMPIPWGISYLYCEYMRSPEQDSEPREKLRNFLEEMKNLRFGEY